MNPRRIGIVLVVLMGAVSLCFWVFFGPIMTALSAPVETERTIENQNLWQLCLVQLLDVTYLLLSGGLIAIAIMAAAGAFGLGLIRTILKNESAGDGPATSGVAALAAGLLTLSLVTLAVGWAGILSKTVFLVILAAMGLTGTIAILRQTKKSPRQSERSPTTTPSAWQLAILIPLGTLALLAATLPAGILWAHDGRGFDSLEYHLQLPREYIQLGAVTRIEHNVYSNFPANAEMLYLLAMALKGDKIGGMYLSQILNVAMAIAFVAGLYLILRQFDKTAAIAAAIAATGAQMFYVATNAYVECYMMLMFLAAVAILIVPYKSNQPEKPSRKTDWRRPLIAGVFAGAACGCKYTAIVMILPAVMILAAAAGNSAAAAAKRGLIVFAAAMAILSPWLIKNTVYCGNPIFPLAADQLGRADWSDSQLARWQQAHRPADTEVAWPMRMRKLAGELATPDRYGGLSLLVVAGAILARRKDTRRLRYACIAAMAVQLLVWIAATHLQSRFLLPIIVPMAVYLAAGRPTARAPWQKKVVLTLTAVVAAIQLWYCLAAYNDSTTVDTKTGGFAPLASRDELIAKAYPFGNPKIPVPTGTKVLLLAESRPFYLRSNYIYNTVFDKCPFVEIILANTGTDELMDYLRQEKITHIYVNWSELERLQRYYRFEGAITRKAILKMALEGRLQKEQTGNTIESLAGSLYKLNTENHKNSF